MPLTSQPVIDFAAPTGVLETAILPANNKQQLSITKTKPNAKHAEVWHMVDGIAAKLRQKTLLLSSVDPWLRSGCQLHRPFPFFLNKLRTGADSSLSPARLSSGNQDAQREHSIVAKKNIASLPFKAHSFMSHR